MFGADTALVFDAMQLVGIAVVTTAGLAFLILRRRKTEATQPDTTKSELEERVEVLERIATDRSIDLADEIESLREKSPVKNLEEQSQ